MSPFEHRDELSCSEMEDELDDTIDALQLMRRDLAASEAARSSAAHAADRLSESAQKLVDRENEIRARMRHVEAGLARIANLPCPRFGWDCLSLGAVEAERCAGCIAREALAGRGSAGTTAGKDGP